MRQLIQYFLIVGYLLLPITLAWSEESRHSVVQQKETTVYVTRTGEKYHRRNCRYLSRSKITTTKSKAIKDGYGACKVCKP